MKIKIRIGHRLTSATPIYPIIPPPPSELKSPRGKKGLPEGAKRRIRNAVGELGPNAIFSTVMLDSCPDSRILNRIRTHLGCDCVGVVEYGIREGWHIHIVHTLSRDKADRILSNYGRCNSEKVRSGDSSGWYMVKGCSFPDSDYPKSWYFCSRSLGRDEVFYVDSTIEEVQKIGIWRESEYSWVTYTTLTTAVHLKKLPRWTDPPERYTSNLCQ